MAIQWEKVYPEATYSPLSGVDENGVRYTISANRETVTAVLPDGRVGAGWTQAEALDAALARPMEAVIVPRHTGAIKKLVMGEHNCEMCGKPIKAGNGVMLTYDRRTSTYTDEDVPDEFSQGGFLFGADCAKQALRQHEEVTQ